ncbi:MAG: molybdopterin-binding protein [Dermabacter sp.]|nr:molybdopterin-binding protein [Dermabacter sp.]
MNCVGERGWSARVIVASTRAARGEYEDLTGPVLSAWLERCGFRGCGVSVVPDGPDGGCALADAISSGLDLAITTGGTGLTPSDVTPEQTRPHLTREIPGIAEALRLKGRESTPYAVVSRGLAGFAGRTLVVNLPGSRGGVKDGMAVLEPIVEHVLRQRDGGGHE